MKKLNIFQKIRNFLMWKFKKFRYRAIFIDDNPKPESIRRDRIYIVGGTDYVKWAYFKCPDNCGDTIMLSLSENMSPSWKIKIDKYERITLFPSVDKLDGCKSHFWLTNGSIKWAVS